MQEKLNEISRLISDLKLKSKQLVDLVKSLNANEMGIKIFINRILKISLQSLDLFGGLERQLTFLNNEYKFKRDSEERKKIIDEKRNRRRS